MLSVCATMYVYVCIYIGVEVKNFVD